MQNEISRAITLFLGHGSAPFPQHDRRQLIQEFGPIRGAELENRITGLLDELGKIKVDWAAHSLSSAGEMARDHMHAHHPGLSDEALSALEWKFTFDWR